MAQPPRRNQPDPVEPPEGMHPSLYDTPFGIDTHEALIEGAAEAANPDGEDSAAPPYLGDVATIDALLRGMGHRLMVPLETGQPEPHPDGPTSKPQSAGDTAQAGTPDAPGLAPDAAEEGAGEPSDEELSREIEKLMGRLAKATGADDPGEGTSPPPPGRSREEPVKQDLPPRRVDPKTPEEMATALEERFRSEINRTARILCGLDRAYRPVANWNENTTEHGLPAFLAAELGHNTAKDGVEQVEAALAVMMHNLFAAAAAAQEGRDYAHLVDATLQQFIGLMVGVRMPQE